MNPSSPTAPSRSATTIMSFVADNQNLLEGALCANVETVPRGASSGHWEIARRARGSMGSLTATT